jgi:diguanylate cyclase (GGDEF)-like protein
VDNFKLYNDRLGHPAGDACLRSVARLLSEVAGRSGDVAARYGGEEFALLLPATDLHGARVVAETLRTALLHCRIAHPASPSGQLTVSIGVAAHIPTGGDEAPEMLVTAADHALYRAKSTGRDRVVTAIAADFGGTDVSEGLTVEATQAA